MKMLIKTKDVINKKNGITFYQANLLGIIIIAVIYKCSLRKKRRGRLRRYMYHIRIIDIVYSSVDIFLNNCEGSFYGNNVDHIRFKSVLIFIFLVSYNNLFK